MKFINLKTKPTLLVRAPLLTNSGYGVHSRQIFESVLSLEDNFDIYAEPLSWGLTSWIVNPDAEEGMIRKILEKSRPLSTDKNAKYSFSIQVQLPDEWDPNIAIHNIGITALVETDLCNPKWINAINNMNEVIVPSEHCLLTIKRTSDKHRIPLETPVTVIPEWFNEKIKNEDISPLVLKLDKESKKYLTIGTITHVRPEDDRKGVINTISAFINEFQGRNDVSLIAKISLGKSSVNDRQIVESFIRDVISKNRKGEYPKIHLVHGNLTTAEMSSLYKMCKNSGGAYLTMTRSEGFGLPLIDAAASGMEVIAINWSGHLDFLKDYSGFKGIDYDLEDVSKERIDGRIFVKGTKWAKPKELHFRNMLSEHANSTTKNIHTLDKKFSKSEIIKRYKSLLLKE